VIEGAKRPVAPVTPILLNRDDAAAYLAMGTSSFDVVVRPEVRVVRRTRIPLWDRRELDRWADANSGRAIS
jgi:hypothetical protein